MVSMTGFGKGEFEADGIKASFELKSVNHRFLDISMRFPKNLSFLEDSVRRELGKYFTRGHIDVYLAFEDKSEGSIEAEIDFLRAAAYVEAASKLSEKFGLDNDFTVSCLLKAPEVVDVKNAEICREKISFVALTALRLASESLKEMREKEGAAIKSDLAAYLKLIEDDTAKIKKLAAGAAADFAVKLKERIKEVIADAAIDENRLMTELAIYADRVAVDEEISRLTAHIEHMRELIDEEGPQGRKLDFLIQELYRETNTIGSKCNDAKVTRLVLVIKNNIEKMREQIQNIE
ncbi:MAG: YicC/YloC family endoribonuclease [Christensenellales bacterium]|jgi:uncharacterized protein (TIGR00255 family)